MPQDKEKIIKLFYDNVKGRRSDTTSSNQKHDGKDGHWLETQMNIKHNGDNEPDLFGYEMKNQTSSGKITFGDWQANEYIFIHGRGKTPVRNNTNIDYDLTRDDFFEIFGKPNELKDGRLSWSGIPCPTYYNQTSKYGQLLTMDNDENIVIIYSFLEDKRINKDEIIPEYLKKENIILAKWYKDSLKLKLERKFNQKGWFTCLKNANDEYETIHFGNPMNYESWIDLFRKRIVFFDSGMYQGNKRPYSQWRASTGFWHSLITDSY
ncbi:MAG: Unknown protein [uncultured Sulfurovum sp.]|uniref:Uncharacterized protein n=1 Tax=uncultured Sulfurovum sp. TaxID=269237 RepID=A0A6S6SF02_9BACT|nr:MAG: Unknown protein [uncultured Sulfurovum sp.]